MNDDALLYGITQVDVVQLQRARRQGLLRVAVTSWLCEQGTLTPTVFATNWTNYRVPLRAFPPQAAVPTDTRRPAIRRNSEVLKPHSALQGCGQGAEGHPGRVAVSCEWYTAAPAGWVASSAVRRL